MRSFLSVFPSLDLAHKRRSVRSNPMASRKGASVVEYALMLMAAALVALASIYMLGRDVSRGFEASDGTVQDALDTAASGTAGSGGTPPAGPGPAPTGPDGSPMLLRVDTGLGGSATIAFRFRGAVDATIDWGHPSANASCPRVVETAMVVSCDYGMSTNAIVAIGGTYDGFGQPTREPDNSVNTALPGMSAITQVIEWGDTGTFDWSGAFWAARNLVDVPPEAPPYGQTYWAFLYLATAFDDPDVGLWDMSGAQNIRAMFNSTNFNQPLNGWNTSNITNMSGVFFGADYNLPLDAWDTSSVTTMEGMFRSSVFNQDISGWDVSSVTDFNSMFMDNVVFSQDLSAWNVGSGTVFASMFRNADSFNADIGGWNMSNASTLDQMFSRADTFNQDISAWDVSGVSALGSMFFQATSFNQPLGAWNVSAVTNFTSMFNGANVYAQDLSGWCVSHIPSTPTNFRSSGASPAWTPAMLPQWGQPC